MLEFVVFLSGAVVMILELAASRLLAPYVGTSLVVWTSLIGVILGSLSLGYWWGGRLADRRPEPRMLSLILLAAAVLRTARGTPIAGGRLVVDRDTPYQRLLVFDLPLPNRPGVRVLSMGFEQYHSAMLLDAPEQLPLPYTKFFRLGPLLRPGMRRSL